MKMFAAIALAVIPWFWAGEASALDVERFVKKDRFETIKISPTGEFFAATVPLEDRTALAIMRRSDNKVTGTVNLGRSKHVADFWWVNDTRVLLSGAQKIGDLDEPQLTGDLYATDAEGGKTDILVGQSLQVMTTGSHIQTKREERIAAFLVDPLRENDKEVVISVSPFSDDPFTRAERMNVDTGRRVTIARAPVRNGRFFTDLQGEVRAVYGVDIDNSSQLYLRKGQGDDWQLINHERISHRIDWPLGFSADGKVLYLQSERSDGPDVIEAYDVASGARKELVADGDRDPHEVIYSTTTAMPVGVRYMDGKPRTAFFDEASADARQQRSLEAAFPGQSPVVTSRTADGKLTLVAVASDRNPGDYYLFDTVAKTASHVISRRDWIDPDAMAESRPVTLAARDGLRLTGYLTLPKGSGRDLPLVLLPHGGPYGIYETWHFDPEAQLLAAAGYATLQVNFRGSGNHGRAFRQAGAREWGGKMQDDLTDATQWAIREGIADPKRICVFGASYGGYAALMAVTKEPALYKCAAGYVGVYDLPMMQKEAARDSLRIASWSREWIGSDDAVLAANSPNRIADRIKVPILLAAGGEDVIAPIEHSKRMENALKSAGVPVETLYYPTEGHGFYVEANRREFYTRLLAFLNRHIGGATVTATAATPAK